MTKEVVDGKIMVWFDCPLCRCPSKDKVKLEDGTLDEIPVTCNVCLGELFIRNSDEP